MTNKRAIHREVMGAGNSTMAARHIGTYGGVPNTIAVSGLRDPLLSVGAVLDAHCDATIVFTAKAAYCVSRKLLEQLIASAQPVAHRATNGLYQTSPQKLSDQLTALKLSGRRQRPRARPLPLTFSDSAPQARGTAVVQPVPKPVEPSRILFSKIGSANPIEISPDTLALPSPWRPPHPNFPARPPRVGDGWSSAGSSVDVGVGDTAGVATAAPSGGGGDMTPDISAITKGKMPLFADLCCGCGGWLVAGELVKWKCVLSTDMCKSIEKWHKKNLDHKYMCGDLTKPEFQKQIINFLKPLNITALMSSPPCEPYALCGRHRPQDPRCKVAEACVVISGRGGRVTHSRIDGDVAVSRRRSVGR